MHLVRGGPFQGRLAAGDEKYVKNVANRRGLGVYCRYSNTMVTSTHWIAVLLLCGTLVCVASVPAVDDPDTAFNEADTPVNLAPPASLRINLIVPVVKAINLPKLALYEPGWGVNNSVHELAAAPKQPGSHSIQKLLCTFLI